MTMRAVLGIATALVLVVGGMGCCLHETCDCCQDICSGCCHNGGYYHLGTPAVPVTPKAEGIEKLPAPAPAPKDGPAKGTPGKVGQ
jgi:hypothetical protein